MIVTDKTVWTKGQINEGGLEERIKWTNERMIVNNYSPKWRWLAVDVYRAAKRQGKFLTLATDTEVNSCFSIY